MPSIDIASESTVKALAERIGVNGDPASPEGATLFALLNYANSLITERLNTDVASRADQGTVNHIANLLNAYIGNLNVDVASRAAQSTVDTILHWVQTYLANLNADVASRADQGTANHIAHLLNVYIGNLNADVASRAAQSTADAIYNLVLSRAGTIDAIYAKTYGQVTADLPRTRPFALQGNNATVYGKGYVIAVRNVGSGTAYLEVDGTAFDKVGYNPEGNDAFIIFKSYVALRSTHTNFSAYGSIEY